MRECEVWDFFSDSEADQVADRPTDAHRARLQQIEKVAARLVAVDQPHTPLRLSLIHISEPTRRTPI
eukprot:1429815-Pleurochrysis_carterae.AAC.1